MQKICAFKKVFSAHLLSHPGFVRSGTPEGGTSLTEGVALGADSREGVAPPVEREEHPPPQPPKKSCRHLGRALLQECCQLRYYYSTQSRLRGGEKKGCGSE